MPRRLLTKSRYLYGLQCPKYLWVSFYEPEKLAEPDAATQYAFDQGIMVGELAKKLFPDGVDVPAGDFMGNIRETKRLLSERRTVFEAGIMDGNVYSRIDILKPVNENEWDIIEVKSSTRVKDVDIQDVAFQQFCCRQAGLELRKCFLAHINREYVRQGEVEPGKLFALEDITDRVAEISDGVPGNVKAMLELIAADSCPDVTIGSQCNSPYGCPIAECWSFLPDGSVFELHRGGQKRFDLFNDGILSINDIPDNYRLTDGQRIQRQSVLSGQTYLDRPKIEEFLRSLQYPVYYLDFETFNPAVPPFDGTRPYQLIPFQFSLNVVNSWESEPEPEHHSFLADGREDPRPELLSALKRYIGDWGSILVYNQAFEKGVFNGLGRAFPEYNDWIQDLLGRFIDLWEPFRKFWYYHPAQKGSGSLKAVMPSLTGRGYEGLDIAEGGFASVEYQRVTYGDVPEEERSRVRADLEEYCGRDTEGMIWIVEALRGIS
ncbi:DUF2779 domain-containing protein [Chloroflexota bacterium]